MYLAKYRTVNDFVEIRSGRVVNLAFDVDLFVGADYDKIVVQFGAEGHAAPGLFFFDDFTFGK